MPSNEQTAGTAGVASEGPAPTPGLETADLTPEALGRHVCLRLLTTEPRTRAQLAEAMRRRGIPAEAAEEVLVQLTAAGLINDAAFAKAWVESRHHSRGLSRRSLSTELRRRGVDGDDITDAVENLDPEQEIATARRLAERKLASIPSGQAPAVRARKVASMLARKGYSPGLAFRLIREVMEKEGADALDLDPDLDRDGNPAPEAGED